MDKYSKKQLTTLLYLHIFKTAEMIGSHESIFDQMPEGKNFEPLFLYSMALYEVHNKTQGNRLPEDIFDDCMAEFYHYLIEKGVYRTDEIRDRLIDANEEMIAFEMCHLSFLTGGQEYGIMEYVPDVLSNFPTARATRIFSYEGTAFAELLPDLVDKILATYNELVSSWDKSLDKPKTAPAAPSDDFIIETYPPAPAEPKKRNTALIVCTVALICSLIGNVFLLSSKEEEPTVAKTYWEDAYRDLYLTCSDLAEEVDGIKEEYLFYHQYAVIVSENNSYYHSYHCKTIDDSTFWIYNIEYAKYLGHRACPECNPDNHGSMAIRKNLESLIDAAPSKPIGPENAPKTD